MFRKNKRYTSSENPNKKEKVVYDAKIVDDDDKNNKAEEVMLMELNDPKYEDFFMRMAVYSYPDMRGYM